MNKYLKNLISEGEHQTQDFKYAINDSAKIARSLAAFANTDGGRLLIGVKDNGKINGVVTDEEYYMVEAAASLYCKPEVIFTTKTYSWEKKTVLEVFVPKSSNGPHKAPAKDGKYKAYVRVKDQNILANKILLKVWARKKRKDGTFLKLTKAENSLLQYLNENDSISLPQFRKLAKINRWHAEKIIVNLLVIDIIEIELSENSCRYKLKKKSEFQL
ncbi:ATP-binding protein [Marinilabiliaceae bacterium ANBcel2]|nr:ATP-binding protein [Marinilabiliaceae bacterium ANBcel2]